MSVEPASPSSFSAASRTGRTANPIGVAASLADGEFNLAGERKIVRVDADSD
ncbi:hypothetical protein [Acidiphilium multivorum]|uniref:hypothetical protein n=1 Tax=Acidiphilium multivorum TaxID=62140 RepID=UPI001F4C0B67|nr:hypothetical protein [Acidiphilium multivorum]